MPKLQKFKKKTNKVNIKNLLISFVIILLGLTILGVYKTFAIYKIDKEYDLIVSKIGDFRGKNQVISYYINNQESDVIPEDKNYEVYVNCENATGVWNESEWKLELSNITKYTVTCTVNFKEKYVIKNAKSTNNSIIANYSNIENISSNYYLYGTDKSNLNQKSSDITNLNSDTTYYFKKCYEDNNEEICSEVSSLLTAGKVTNFDYTGGEQNYTTTCNGTYKLETWGASGGYSSDLNNSGYGGYSDGKIYLNKDKKLYINIGGQGVGYAVGAIGGYNGGGDSGTIGVSASGGGATHIAVQSGILTTLKNYISSILIVSGGGGGSGNTNALAGNGGGYIGSYNENTGFGGTYTTGYMFGKGQSGGANDVGGAGGGFYGGTLKSLIVNDDDSGSGGSGYIGNSLLINKAMYCYDCEENDGVENPSYKTISTTGSNADTTNCPDGYSSSPISKCAKAGNGYARITIEECSI